MMRQLELTLVPRPHPALFPSTRYQGSKRKLLPWIASHLRELRFDTALDAMSGTAAVAYLLKQMGKQVVANDRLFANAEIARALIENPGERLCEEDIEKAMQPRPGVLYSRFIEETFAGIYFTDEENRWLDVAVSNIGYLKAAYKQALAWSTGTDTIAE